MVVRISRAFKWVTFSAILLLSLWITVTATRLYHHGKAPVDGVLVLGGSIRREMAIADWAAGSSGSSISSGEATGAVQSAPGSLVNQNAFALAPDASSKESLPILISKGSKPPCIRLLFERVDAPLQNVWLEDCARSTFDNYRYSLPILTQWNVHHVSVITSPSHLPRAKWLAQIMLGRQGIWVDMALVEETGIPGNVERPLKTGLDVGRSLLWTLISPWDKPVCNHLIALESVDLAQWTQRGFKCERQANIEIPQ